MRIQLYILNKTLIYRLICSVNNFCGYYTVYIQSKLLVYTRAYIKSLNMETFIPCINIVYTYPIFSNTALLIAILYTQPFPLVDSLEYITSYAVHLLIKRIDTEKNKTEFNIQGTLKTLLGDICCEGWI